MHIHRLLTPSQWLDIFSSLSLNRVPKFLGLWKSLLDPQKGCPQMLHMASLTGCSEDTLLAVAEISQLANWKAMQMRNGSLSYPELVSRGKKIQDSIKQHQAMQGDLLHSYGPVGELGEGEPATEAQKAACISIFRESALLYLHTILSNSSPGESCPSLCEMSRS
jgi:C6 transcription factor Pro1